MSCNFRTILFSITPTKIWASDQNAQIYLNYESRDCRTPPRDLMIKTQTLWDGLGIAYGAQGEGLDILSVCPSFRVTINVRFLMIFSSGSSIYLRATCRHSFFSILNMPRSNFGSLIQFTDPGRVRLLDHFCLVSTLSHW